MSENKFNAGRLISLYGIRVLLNSNTTPWSSIDHVSVPLPDRLILEECAGRFHRTTPDALVGMPKDGLRPGLEAGRSRSSMAQLSPHCPWGRQRTGAQGRADWKYSICLSFDRLALYDENHRLHIAPNGAIVTDQTLPPDIIDRIWELQDNGDWVDIGLMGFMACRIPGKAGGIPDLKNRDPAQTEIEDHIRRSNTAFDDWQTEIKAMQGCIDRQGQD